jgi:hypothetical protein
LIYDEANFFINTGRARHGLGYFWGAGSVDEKGAYRINFFSTSKVFLAYEVKAFNSYILAITELRFHLRPNPNLFSLQNFTIEKSL